VASWIVEVLVAHLVSSCWRPRGWQNKRRAVHLMLFITVHVGVLLLAG